MPIDLVVAVVAQVDGRRRGCLKGKDCLTGLPSAPKHHVKLKEIQHSHDDGRFQRWVSRDSQERDSLYQTVIYEDRRSYKQVPEIPHTKRSRWGLSELKQATSLFHRAPRPRRPEQTMA